MKIETPKTRAELVVLSLSPVPDGSLLFFFYVLVLGLRSLTKVLILSLSLRRYQKESNVKLADAEQKLTMCANRWDLAQQGWGCKETAQFPRVTAAGGIR